MDQTTHNQPVRDSIIVGGGPAGLAAGVYIARARLDAVLLERGVPGGQLLLTETIENYPGFAAPIGADTLVNQMVEQCTRFGLQHMQANVEAIVTRPDGLHEVRTSEGPLLTRTVVICVGAVPRKLGIPGESAFTGRGVSYCGTCDGAFFRGRNVAVIGGGDTAVEEGMFLTRFCPQVTIVHRRHELRAQKILQERAFANKKVSFILGALPLEIIGETTVRGLRRDVG